MTSVAEVVMFGPVVDVKVAGDLAVVGIQSTRRRAANGVAVLDISDPRQPEVIAEVELAHLSGVHNLFLHRQRAYLAHNDAPGMTVLDLSDPSEPVITGFWLNDNGFSNAIHDVFIRDNLAFVSDTGAQGGLAILDLADLDEPMTLSSVAIPESLHSAWYENGYVYCNQELGGPTRALRVIDVSDPRNPVSVSTFGADLPETSTALGPHNPWARDGLLYWAYFDAGLRIFDLARPDRPVEIGDFPTGPDSGAWGVQPHKDGLLYMADMELGLLALRFEEPAHRIDLVSLNSEPIAGRETTVTVTAATSPSPRSAPWWSYSRFSTRRGRESPPWQMASGWRVCTLPTGMGVVTAGKQSALGSISAAYTPGSTRRRGNSSFLDSPGWLDDALLMRIQSPNQQARKGLVSGGFHPIF